MSGKDNSRTRQAVRRAREARAAREEALAAREEAIEAALVDYFRSAAEVDRIKQQAQAKVDTLVAEATRVAAVPWAEACAAVRRLRELVRSNAQVAELCGLKLEDVRDMLAAARPNDESLKVDETAGPRESSTEAHAGLRVRCFGVGYVVLVTLVRPAGLSGSVPLASARARASC
jgi:hypothetical protein